MFPLSHRGLSSGHFLTCLSQTPAAWEEGVHWRSSGRRISQGEGWRVRISTHWSPAVPRMAKGREGRWLGTVRPAPGEEQDRVLKGGCGLSGNCSPQAWLRSSPVITAKGGSPDRCPQHRAVCHPKRSVQHSHCPVRMRGQGSPPFPQH